MSRKLGFSLAVCALALFTGAAAVGQAPSEQDKHWVHDAIEGGNGEVELGHLAQRKGNSDDVRRFGQHMVEDHTKLGMQVKAVAAKTGVNAPSGTAAGAMATKAELEVLSGDAFDKAYIKAMVKDHRDDLEAFQKEADGGTNPQIREAAKKGAQVVQSHLQMAEQIARNHNVDVGR